MRQKNMVSITEVSSTPIEMMIVEIRGRQVIVDRDLAMLYGVETKVLNQAVKRNIERFPDSFRFQLSLNENNTLVTNCDRFKTLKHSSSLPFVFTEQGVAMLSSVLRSRTAISVSIQIMNAFVAMRHYIANNTPLLNRIELVEVKQMSLAGRVDNTENQIDKIFAFLEKNNNIPTQGVFCNGQIFDAYAFVSQLIRSAKEHVILIDNYVDESILKMLTKRADGVSATIITKRIPDTLALDLARHDQQYPHIEVLTGSHIHDRFPLHR